MNALTPRSRHRSARGAETPAKAVLFCPSCGRSAPPDGWTVTAAAAPIAPGDVDADDAGATEVLSCPDCGETLTARPAGRN